MHIMSRRTLERHITKLYDNVNIYLKEKFKGIEWVMTTADIWSTKYRSFIGITAHWVLQKIEYYSNQN